ncbi:MAG: DUF3047 domain-containing protein [Nitrospirota bacterium]
MKRRASLSLMLISVAILVSCALVRADDETDTIDLGLSFKGYQEGQVPSDWTLRKWFGFPRGASAAWNVESGLPAVKLRSKGALTFLEKWVDIDIRAYPIVMWKWRVNNILQGNDETTKSGDDHPIRLLFVFAPDESQQSLWFRLKRFLYLDRVHGHPMGSRFIEYLWSGHLRAGDVIDDPGKSGQKLVVVEGGSTNLGRWLSYQRNLYREFQALYGEEPRRLVKIGILNDTDQTGQEAVSYIADLTFRQSGTVD